MFGVPVDLSDFRFGVPTPAASSPVIVLICTLMLLAVALLAIDT